jgi:phage-related protein
MPLPTFTPSIAPSPGAKSTPVVSLFTAEFGDGYTQAGPRGLNHIRENLDLRWDGIMLDQKQELDAFFRGLGGYKPFLYQPYGFTQPVQWTCSDWNWSSAAPISFTAKLVQDFSLTA